MKVVCDMIMAEKQAYRTIMSKPVLVEHVRRTEPFNMLNHCFHEEYEIYYLVSGERYYYLENEFRYVSAGDFVILDKNLMHRTETIPNKPDHERILLNFSQEYFESLFKLVPEIDLSECFRKLPSILRVEAKKRQALANIMWRLVEEQQTGNSESYLKILVVELMVMLNRLAEEPLEQIPQIVMNASYKKIYSVISYINEFYMEDLSLSKLAEQFYLSPFHLSRTFKKVTGFTVVEYLNNIRIRKAQALLRETDSNVTKIMEVVGFQSLTHFERIFKRISKVTPLQYRNLRQNSALEAKN
jgi:AraC-like DNA-binding protein